MTIKIPELLCPAGDLNRLKIAVDFGADAVYIAGEEFGMRTAAAKFGKEDMKRALETQKQIIIAAENAYSESVKGQEDNGKIEYKVFLAQLRSAFENLIEEEENLVSDARYYSVMILHYYSLFANKYLV